jgi:hypothetical protein
LPPKTAPKQVAKFQQSLYGQKQQKAQPSQITPKDSAAKTPWFVTLTRWGGKRFSGLAKNTTFSLEEAEVFEFMGFGVSSDEYRSTYYGILASGLAIALLVSFGILYQNVVYDPAIKIIFAGIVALLPLVLGYVYLKMPFTLADREKKLALAYTPEIVNYLVMSMRLTPNLEKAVEFAATHGRGKIAEDLKTVLWRTQLGTYFSVEEGLDELAYRWGPYSDEFKHALMLIRSSVMEADSARRNEMLERAAADVLEGSKEKMDIYARQLSQPTVYLYYFGILLPLLLAIVLPIGGAMTGMDIAKAEYIFIVYNVFIPIGVYVFGSNILGTRPPTYVPPDIPEDFPTLPRKGVWEVGSLKVPYKAAAVAAFFILLGAGLFADKFMLESLPGYRLAENPVKSMLHVPWLYDNYGILFGQFSISGLLLGFAVSICVYLLGKYSARKAVQDQVRSMETEFKDALYVLASRLGENRPMEEALRQAVEFLPKSRIASDVFRRILQNVSEMGMTLESAIFDPAFGAVRDYPSEIIRGGMQIMVDSVELGVNVAAKSLLSLSMQIRNQQKIDEMLRKLLSDVTTMLGTMSMFIAPIVLAVVSALQRMVTGAITSSCATQSASAGTAATSGVAGFSAISFCPAGKDVSQISADPATFVIIMGVYCIEIVILLTYFNSQIEDTNNELHTYVSVAYALPIAAFLYVAVSFAVGMYMNLG